MTLPPSLSQLELIADHIVSVMDDPRTFETPVPACDSEDGHDWVVVHNKTVTRSFGRAVTAVTYRVAISCRRCTGYMGIG